MGGGTLSAFLKASITVISGNISFSFSLGITMRVSTFSCSFLMPFSALTMRFFPSLLKGLLTIPIVRIPISLACAAIIGAAPVPVPPPIPAAIKRRSVSFKKFFISSRDSSAALRPTSGFAPAPSPLVNSLPSCNLTLALDFFKSLILVLATANSIPCNL